MTESLYLISAVLFILALKLFSRPSTAFRANNLAIGGMVLAIISAFDLKFADYDIFFYLVILVSAGLGVLVSNRVQMTQMPELVGIFNGLGGGASGAIAYVEISNSNLVLSDFSVAVFSMTVGVFTFSGSLIAVAKLRGKLNSFNATLINLLSGVLLVGVVALLVTKIDFSIEYIIILSLLLGITRVVLIGGADMPVVIAFLNSLSGIAAMAAGFIVNSIILIVAGALVGASGIILTLLMCAAMNRTIYQVLKGGFGTTKIDNEYEKDPISTSAEDIAIQLSYAESVVIVPGYGMAVAQAQHALREMVDTLKKNDIKVSYAIHPVAGRMPGHMNVLLTEANVPYDEVFELEEINNDFANADVAFVIGANDVTNPVAKTDPQSPIYGMPVLDVEKSKSVLFVKRSLSPGYAGIDNDLFYRDNTLMLFADAKKMTEDIIKNL